MWLTPSLAFCTDMRRGARSMHARIRNLYFVTQSLKTSDFNMMKPEAVFMNGHDVTVCALARRILHLISGSDYVQGCG